ncbi:hypothetical protein Q5P01_019456 [Channa striata]|uniref:Uncharacterized protein n=1 Tax=Channa striata TaxID=64152 RepID=A0AA88M362_CHASR|nr:hypothetical protein Q5P01_019456 [Channa striata]
MRCAVDSSRLSPRRLRFPAPLFSLGGGLSQREAVLNQQPHSSVGTPTRARRSPNPFSQEILESRLGAFNLHRKFVFSVADAALRWFWSRDDPCASVGLVQQQQQQQQPPTRRLCSASIFASQGVAATNPSFPGRRSKVSRLSDTARTPEFLADI